MKQLDQYSVSRFLAGNNMPTDRFNLSVALDEVEQDCMQVPLPDQFGIQLSALRFLFQNGLKETRWSLVIVECTSIWPSWEDKNLYNLMLTSKGLSPNPADGHGILFSGEEIEDLITFANVYCSFRWDFRIVTEALKAHLFFSHDDFARIYFADVSSGFLNSFREIFTQVESDSFA